MKIPRILIGAGSSGSGKTLITCGILQALVNRNKKVASFKCGPDYIDPMFHSKVIGTASRNLDTFFSGEEITRYLLQKNAAECEIAVLEGVMGYYDGVAGTTTQASAYDLARITGTPAVLIVNSRGMSVSLAAYIRGFLEYRSDSQIRAVIFNQMSPMLYPRMKKLVEDELGVRVLGYVPKVEDCVIESRHLGLVLPEEIPALQERLNRLAEILEKTLDMEGLLQLAEEAGELKEIPELSRISTDFTYRLPRPLRIGIADDEAFCFFYADNLDLLREMGAQLIPFSPVRDRTLPEELDGLLLYGGYPELNGAALEKNETMRESVRGRIQAGMPCMAECGGFMYLHEEMEDMDGVFRRMAGVIPGKVYRTGSLKRFGYIHLKDEKCGAYDQAPAHEFHYFESENCGTDLYAAKPSGSRGWACMHRTDTLFAGFPHLYYYGKPSVARQFLESCLTYHNRRKKKEV